MRDAGAIGNGDLDGGAVGQRERVVARMGGFMAVVEGLRVAVAVLVRADRQLAGKGENGKVRIKRAAGAAEVGEGEAVDAVLVGAIPAVGGGVGAPLRSCRRAGSRPGRCCRRRQFQ